MWLWLVLQLWFLFAVASGHGTRSSSTQDSVSVLLVALPHVGHLVPMAALGEELVRRGHAVALCTMIASDSELQHNIVKRAGMKIVIVEDEYLISDYLVKLENEASNSTVFESLYSSDGILQDVGDPLKGLVISYSKTLDSLNISSFDIVIIDINFSPILSCITKKWNSANCKMVTLSTDLSFNANLLPPPPPVPVLHTGVKPILTAIQRYITAIIHPVLRLVLHIGHAADLQCTDDVHEPYGHIHPHLITSVIGFKFPQPTSPLVEYVGPLLSKESEPLSTELSQWLNSKPDLSVVYINFDSEIYLTVDQAQNILKGALATNSSVVWTSKKIQHILEGVTVDPENVFVSCSVSSLSLLQHRAIGASIIHGTLGGIQNSLSNGVPVLLVPFTTHHRDNAAPVVKYQLGKSILPLELSTENVAKAIVLIKSGTYQINMAKLQRVYHSAGGVERAAFLIELFHEAGYDNRIPAYAKYNWSWVEYYDVDVYAFLGGIMMLASYCITKCCAWLCRGTLYYRENSTKQKSD